MTRGLLECGSRGIFHCVGPETMTRADFATLVATALSLDHNLIKRTSSEQLYTSTMNKRGHAAHRGKNLRLNTDKMKGVLPIEFQARAVKEALLHWLSTPYGAKLPL